VGTHSLVEPCQPRTPIVIWDVLGTQRMFMTPFISYSLYRMLYHHSEACGGPNRVSVYSSSPVVTLPVPIAQKTNLPGKWTYAGCLREPATGKMFSNQIIWIGNNSAVACMNQCAAFGYPASGVEVSYIKDDKVSELTCIFLPFYLVWSRMLCVSMPVIKSHNSLNDC
jgi:hypothetical protein